MAACCGADGSGRVVFESGALNPDGSIVGNDNDADPLKYEPHYREITRADQVEIYEPILKDSDGKVTTGLLHAVGYLKDNRLLPHGFDKATAMKDIAVTGGAADDPGFTDKGSTVRYVVSTGGAAGPFKVEAELWYQPIGFRWAHNLSLQGERAAADGAVLRRSGGKISRYPGTGDGDPGFSMSAKHSMVPGEGPGSVGLKEYRVARPGLDACHHRHLRHSRLYGQQTPPRTRYPHSPRSWSTGTSQCSARTYLPAASHWIDSCWNYSRSTGNPCPVDYAVSGLSTRISTATFR